MILLWFNGRFA